MKIAKPAYKILNLEDGTKILKHLELVARTCYKSEGLITDDDSSARKIIAGIIKSGHESILEHIAFTVRFTADVGFYKDLTRHRAGISFAIESTRWCNYANDKFGGELTFMAPANMAEGTEIYEKWAECMQGIEKAYMAMAALGAKPDQLRMILPHSTKADINITTNIREWRHIFRLRIQPNVHPSIRQLLIPLLAELKQRLPVVFDDIIVPEGAEV